MGDSILSRWGSETRRKRRENLWQWEKSKTGELGDWLANKNGKTEPISCPKHFPSQKQRSLPVVQPVACVVMTASASSRPVDFSSVE